MKQKKGIPMALRSMLFVPGNDANKMVKALNSGADAVVLDLADSVPVSEKMKARKTVKDFLQELVAGTVYVRVNPCDSRYFWDDMQEIICPGLAGIILAKTETPADVVRANWLLKELETRKKLEPGKIELMPLIETARGIWYSYAIAQSDSRIARLAFNALGYASDLGINVGQDEMEIFYARSQLVLASRVAGIEPPVDTIYDDLNNMAGLFASAARGRQMGFQGKLVIHPKQVEPVNKVFSLQEEEIAFARKAVLAFEEALARGKAAIQVDGKMIDYPVARRLKSMLSLINVP
ncbi:MAG: citrate lyase subunit beta / citryl-CoA lyase [Clostridia bacterium]|nr:citrate lyase subunit beta / citryl-CoA lyase [Clostridia bacterium]